ncbi:MAG: histidine phosphatase family protein [Candidatus Paceibacterota bacterium]
MNIYFVRHGSTDGNESDQFQLPTIALSEKGNKQAEFMAERFKAIPIDVIFASPMMRASQTAKAIAQCVGHEVVEDPIFEEIKRPSAVRGQSKSEPEVKAIMKIVKETFTDPNNRHSDEEDYFQIKNRGQKIMELLSKRKEQNILVVTHGEILKMVLALVIFGDKLTPDIFEEVKRTFVPHNTGITLIQYDHSFGLHESGWYVLGWNDHAHLGEIK